MASLVWIGWGELVVSDIAWTGRIQTGVVLVSLIGMFAALSQDAAVRLGTRALVDAFARLVFLPPHPWSLAVLALDALVFAVAVNRSGKEPDRKGSRWGGCG